MQSVLATEIWRRNFYLLYFLPPVSVSFILAIRRNIHKEFYINGIVKCICTCVCGLVHLSVGAYGVQKRVLEPLELEL